MPDSELPPPVDIGFLPPENGTGRGMGHVNYTITCISAMATCIITTSRGIPTSEGPSSSRGTIISRGARSTCGPSEADIDNLRL